MKTIKELHDMPDSPDLSGWKLKEIFTLNEAAMLCAAIDPNVCRNVQEALNLEHPNAESASSFLESIIEAALLNRIRLITAEIAVNAFIPTGIRGETEYFETRQVDVTKLNPSLDLCPSSTLSLAALKKWATRHGLDFKLGKPKSPFHDNNWPEPLDYVSDQSYRTPALDLLNKLIHEKWRLYDQHDPSTASPKTECMEWLRATNLDLNLKLSENTLICIDSIARHPSQKGGNHAGRKKSSTS